MNLLSGSQDFVRRTLAAIPTLWGRLVYLDSLQNDDGVYMHWGMERVYGAVAAQQAIAEAHRQAGQQALNIPIRELWSSYREFLEEAQQGTLRAPESFAVAEVSPERIARLRVPPQVDSLAAAHFNLVRDAIYHLAAAHEQPRPAA